MAATATSLPGNATDTRPALESGDRMDRAEFERRYMCRPDIKKAELIKGVVYVASPVRIIEHGDPHGILVGELHAYRKATPGVLLTDNGTWRPADGSEVQPDAMLRYARSSGGTSWSDVEHYLQGVPELVAEVSASSKSYDLNEKMALYREMGVREYISWQTEEERIDWWKLQDGRYVAIEPDAQGLLRSQVFPGLALDVTELLRMARESADDTDAFASLLSPRPL